MCLLGDETVYAFASSYTPLTILIPRQRQLLSCSISSIKAEHSEQKANYSLFKQSLERVGQKCDGGNSSDTCGNSDGVCVCADRARVMQRHDVRHCETRCYEVMQMSY